MSGRVLFIVNGLGLGNSSRCHAVIQQLVTYGHKICVATSANGLWYFEGKAEIEKVIPISPLYYSKKDGRISISGTLKSAGDFYSIIRSNSIILNAILSDFRPDLVITDSEYTFLPIRRKRVKHVALNNSDVVVSAWKRSGDRPKSIRAQFYAVEFSDYLFHRSIPDLVISPTLDASIPALHNNFFRVGPIVRLGYAPINISRTKEPERVVIMLSGSTFGSKITFDKKSYPFGIDVVGRSAPDGMTVPKNVIFHGRVQNTHPLISAARLVVVNGGFSAVSEAFCMRKPMIVVPVPNHAEQWINGKTISFLEVGSTAGDEQIEQAMFVALDNLEKFKSNYDKIPETPRGAIQAAEIINDIMSGELC